MARIARCADVVLPELELPLELEPDPPMFGQLGFVLDPPEGGVCVVPPPDGVTVLPPVAGVVVAGAVLSAFGVAD